MLRLGAHWWLRVRLHTNGNSIRIIYRTYWPLIPACVLDFFLSHVCLIALLAIGDEGRLVKRDSLCAERSIKVFHLSTLVALERPHERLPRLATHASRRRAPTAAVVLPIRLGLCFARLVD